MLNKLATRHKRTHRNDPRAHNEDRKTFVMTTSIYSNITLLQKPNCKKYIAVQNVCIVTSSSCKTYELWHENFINTLLNWKPSKDFYEVFITKHFWPELYIFIIILNERLRFKESLVMENRTIKTTYLE